MLFNNYFINQNRISTLCRSTLSNLKLIHMQTALQSLKVGDLIIDHENKIIEVKWRGILELESSREMFAMCTEAAKDLGYSKVMLNRLDITDITEETRKWIKGEYLRNEAKKILPYLTHVATVESKSDENIWFKAFNFLVGLLVGKVKMKNFRSRQQAIKWLIEG